MSEQWLYLYVVNERRDVFTDSWRMFEESSESHTIAPGQAPGEAKKASLWVGFCVGVRLRLTNTILQYLVGEPQSGECVRNFPLDRFLNRSGTREL